MTTQTSCDECGGQLEQILEIAVGTNGNTPKGAGAVVGQFRKCKACGHEQEVRNEE